MHMPSSVLCVCSFNSCVRENRQKVLCNKTMEIQSGQMWRERRGEEEREAERTGEDKSTSVSGWITARIQGKVEFWSVSTFTVSLAMTRLRNMLTL